MSGQMISLIIFVVVVFLGIPIIVILYTIKEIIVSIFNKIFNKIFN